VIVYENSEESGKTVPPLSHDVLEYEQTARKSASAGQLLTAIEVARDGLKRYGQNKVLQQQLALALAQTGALDGAREVLGELLSESATDEETLSLLGRVYKELWRRASDPNVATDAIKQSCKFYGDAFAIRNDYYPGINLAFTLAAAGELKQAEEIARHVEKTCRAEIGRAPDKADGWLFATLAEALTHQGATSAAAEYYKRAATLFKGRWRDLASMRKQAREIIGFAAKAPEGSRGHWYDLASLKRRARELVGRSQKGQEWLDACFEFPSVVVFSGHMMDRPGRNPPRFPPEEEARVRDEIRAYLRSVNAGFGYSSAACGADIIFCECLLELDAKVHLVLPCPVNAFKRQSVAWAGPEWEQRFLKVLSLATTTLIASPADFSSNGDDPASTMGLVYANRIITGLAVLQAQALDFELRALAVWDGQNGVHGGGTGSVVTEWTERQLNPHIVRLPIRDAVGPASGQTVPSMPPFDAVNPTDAGGIRHEIKAMVFAEVINHAKVGERQMPAFVREFKGAVAGLIAESKLTPAVAESWGKSQYFVYDSLQEAALFALALRDMIGRTNWSEHGLPADLGIRLVLHAGPVYAFVDPVLQRQTCIGLHLGRAARIEPITPPGQVYATQEFAALCSAEDLSAVSFEFLGNLRTAKLMEEAPLYRLDRRSRRSA
jgi:tetratricopeptide (TPR) repeat protein/class 3 adenylate cyclase